MKIRTGFVSNSSSSSFCLCGITVEKEPTIQSSSILQCESGISEYYDEYVVGVDVCRMKDDETLLQFKTRIFEDIKKLYPTDNEITIDDIRFIVDGGMDN